MRCLKTVFMTTLLLSSGIAFADIHREINDIRQNVQDEVVKDPQDRRLIDRDYDKDRSVIDNQDALDNEKTFDNEDIKDLREHDLKKEMKRDLEVDGSDGTETVEEEELLD